ncbi:MAG: hypothetical protein ACTHK4_02690 [Mycobacteriales bacterium]
MSQGGVIDRVPAAHRRWIILNSLIITAVLNAVISTGVALAQAHGDHVVAWSLSPIKTTLLGNTVGTLFSLPLITTLLVSAAIRREQRLGTLPAITWPFERRVLSWIAVPGALRRGWRLGVVTFLVLAPIDVLLVVLLGRHGTTAIHFAVLQAVVGVVLGAVLTPLIALAAMCDEVAPAT